MSTRADTSTLRAWWQAYQQEASAEAREKLITHYLYLVKYAVGRMLVNLPGHLDPDDLIGYGLMGLIQSVEKFELARNVRFETFAMTRIRGAILDQLRAMDWMPRSLRQKAKEIEQAIARIEQETGRSAEEGAIADELGMDVDTLRQNLSETSFLVLSLDYLLNPHEEGSESLGANIPDPGLRPDEHAEQESLRESLKNAIATLPEREQKLIAFYYFEGLTMKEIGRILQVTEARICQLHAQAIHRLRARLKVLLS
ncbi:MAG: FliA/WhiG family RNA polymerase sigma factor [Candidatus Sericytochromatia bacterium]